jgi:hypothetical protein
MYVIFRASRLQRRAVDTLQYADKTGVQFRADLWRQSWNSMLGAEDKVDQDSR